MSKKWRKLWTVVITTALLSLFYTAVGLGIVYIVCWLISLIYKILIGG